MGERKDLHRVLCDILDGIPVPEGTIPASKRVYFQPPESIKLVYPCIVYKRDKKDAKYASNAKYAKSTRYQVTTMDPDPDGSLADDVFELRHCAHLRKFAVSGLNHDVFEINF